MKNIIAIEVNTRPVRYVQAMIRREAGGYMTELTENKNLAHDFGTMERAREAVNKIFNPFERVFKPVSIKASRPEQIGTYLESLKLS